MRVILLAFCLCLTSCYRKFLFNHVSKKHEVYVGQGRPFQTNKKPKKAAHTPQPYYNVIK